MFKIARKLAIAASVAVLFSQSLYATEEIIDKDFRPSTRRQQTTFFSDQENDSISVYKAVQRLQSLYLYDQELKATYSYQTLQGLEIVYESVCEYPTYGIWGVLYRAAYNLGARNTPALLCGVANRVLPQKLQQPFHQMVSSVFPIMHAYDCSQRPKQHALGYASGFAGVYLVQQLEQLGLDEQYHKEIEGIAYYLCRRAGVYAGDTINIGTLQHFFQGVKQFDPFPLNCFAAASEIKGSPYDFRKQRLGVGQCPSPQSLPFQSHPNPICYYIRQNPKDSKVWQTYNPDISVFGKPSPVIIDGRTKHIVEYLTSEYQNSTQKEKAWRLILGEHHSDPDCAESRQVVMHFMDGKVSTLNLELGQWPLDRQEQDWLKANIIAGIYMDERHLMQEDERKKADSFIHQISQLNDKLHRAFSLNFYVQKVERDYKELEVYDPAYEMLDLVQIPSKENLAIWMDTLEKSKNCKNFFHRRDIDMAKNIESSPPLSLTIVGRAHIPGIRENLNDKDYHTTYLICKSRDSSSFDNDNSNKILLLNYLPLTTEQRDECTAVVDEEVDAWHYTQQHVYDILPKEQKALKKKS